MRCLVTGGAGFIGSHLCDELIRLEHEVVCIDNLITGNKDNIAHLLTHPHFTFLEKDCVKELALSQKVDFIFHLASPASPPKYQEFSLETMLVNTLGTYYLLELAKTDQIPLIFASTSEVYGDPAEHPQKETYWGHVNPTGIRSCYDEGKRAGEALVMIYVRKYGVDGRIIRIFNTYGPRMDIDDGRVVTNFIKAIKTRTSLTVNGDGKQTRSFCYVSDLVSGIIKVFTSSQVKGEVINLGNQNEMTVLELAKTLKKLTAYQGAIEFQSLPPDDPSRRRPDISKAISLLRWEPLVNLEDGLKKTIDYFLESTK